MGEFVPRPKTPGGDIPCLDSPELARKRQKALSARAELRAERLLRAESNLETPVETQADGAPLVRISDLSAGYDKKVVVEGVDLEVRAGDVVALIGPNGSGKSTILKTITRHLYDDCMLIAKNFRLSEQVKQIYSLRKQTIERVFAEGQERHDLRVRKEIPTFRFFLRMPEYQKISLIVM